MNDALKTSRPADTSLIRFSADCFETVGFTTHYTVARLAPLYPKRFDTRIEAEAFAKMTRRAVTEHTTPILRRVKWF